MKEIYMLTFLGEIESAAKTMQFPSPPGVVCQRPLCRNLQYYFLCWIWC